MYYSDFSTCNLNWTITLMGLQPYFTIRSCFNNHLILLGCVSFHRLCYYFQNFTYRNIYIQNLIN